MFACIFCAKEYSTPSGKGLHEKQCASNPNAKNFQKGRRAWNQGLTRLSNVSVAAQAATLKKRLQNGETKQSVKTADGLRRLSESAKAHNLGGYRPHPNKGQYYKGIWFDSKWEVKVAISLDENGISWVRPRTGFVWNESGNRYYPDFYLEEFDVYLDPKNPYLQIKDSEKIKNAQIRNNIRVLVLGEQQLEWEKIKLLL